MHSLAASSCNFLPQFESVRVRARVSLPTVLYMMVLGRLAVLCLSIKAVAAADSNAERLPKSAAAPEAVEDDAITPSTPAAATAAKEDGIRLSPGEQLLAGSVARIVAQTVLHPLEVVRTRRQAVGVRMRWDAPTLLRGLAPQFALSAPAGALLFGTLEATKTWVGAHPELSAALGF